MARCRHAGQGLPRLHERDARQDEAGRAARLRPCGACVVRPAAGRRRSTATRTGPSARSAAGCSTWRPGRTSAIASPASRCPGGRRPDRRPCRTTRRGSARVGADPSDRHRRPARRRSIPPPRSARYVVIEGPVRVGPRTRVMAHAVLTGRTRHRRGQRDPSRRRPRARAAGPEVSRDAPTGLRIGDRNVIREHVEIHRGTAGRTRGRSSATTTTSCRTRTSPTTAWSATGRSSRSGALARGPRRGRGPGVRVGQLRRAPVHVASAGSRSCAGCRARAATSRRSRSSDGTHTVRGVNRVGLRRAGFDAGRIRAVVQRVPHAVPRARRTCARPWRASRPSARRPTSTRCWRSSARRSAASRWARGATARAARRRRRIVAKSAQPSVG